MKKILFSCTGALLLVVIIVFSLNGSSHTTVPAQLLPSDTILYMEQQDLSGSIESFVESRFGKSFLGLNMGAIARDLNLTEPKRAALEEEWNRLKGVVDNPLLHQLFGKTAVLALLPDRSAPNTQLLANLVGDRLVVIARPKQSTQIIEKIADVYSGKDNVTTSSYGEFKIYRIENGSQTISVSIVDGFLIMALQERQLRLCLDVYDTVQPSLQENEEYQYHRALYQDINRFAYLSVDMLRGEIATAVGNFTPIVAQIVEDEMQTTMGVSSASYSGWSVTDAYEDKVVVKYTLDGLSDTLRHQLSKKPLNNSTKTWIPSDVVGYYWTNTLDLEMLWKLYSDPDTGVPWLREIDQIFQENTGEDLTNVLATLGAETSFMLKAGEENQLIPVPEIACLIKAEDPARVESILATLVQKYYLPMQQETYKDVSYHYFGMRLQGNLQPVYGFYNDFLIFTTNPELFKNIIDTSLDNGGLITTAQFQAVDTGIRENNNAYGYLQVEHFLEETKKILRWSSTMFAIQDPESAVMASGLLDHMALPLLDGLMMYTESSSRSHFSEDAIFIESRTMLNNQ